VDVFLQFMSVSRDGGGVKGCDLLHSANVRMHDGMFGRIHQVHRLSLPQPLPVHSPPLSALGVACDPLCRVSVRMAAYGLFGER